MCLILLLSILSCIVSAKIINREKPTPQVSQENLDKTKLVLDNMLEAGRKRNLKEFKKTWLIVPSGKEGKQYMEFIGKDFAGKFDLVNSELEDKGTIALYGSFESGVMLTVRMKKKDNTYCIVSMESL